MYWYLSSGFPLEHTAVEECSESILNPHAWCTSIPLKLLHADKPSLRVSAHYRARLFGSLTCCILNWRVLVIRRFLVPKQSIQHEKSEEVIPGSPCFRWCHVFWSEGAHTQQAGWVCVHVVVPMLPTKRWTYTLPSTDGTGRPSLSFLRLRKKGARVRVAGKRSGCMIHVLNSDSMFPPDQTQKTHPYMQVHGRQNEDIPFYLLPQNATGFSTESAEKP